MSRTNRIVKLAAALLLATLLSAAARAGEDAPKPHLLYFYNPSCRLCTATNEVVSAAEEKYKNAMSFQRFDIADAVTGAEDVMYMFDLMDELQLPETDGTTLVVFIGLLETIDGEVYFTPMRSLVDGENIIEKLDAEIADFLANEGGVALAEEGGSSGSARRAPFFFQRHGAEVAPELPQEISATDCSNYPTLRGRRILLVASDESVGAKATETLFYYGCTVETATGKTQVDKMTMMCDPGSINNRLVVDGQIYGGLTQGIGLALTEDFEDIEKHATMLGAGIPYIKDVPDDMEIQYFEWKREFGPFGAAGVGEIPLTAPHPAILNAIYNACGARVTRIPARPELVLEALSRA